jgi:hypothetical protein
MKGEYMSNFHVKTPAHTHRFRVFPLGLGNHISQAFSMQVVKSTVDFTKNTLTVYVRQSLEGSELGLVKMVVENNCAFQIDFLTATGDDAYTSFYTTNSHIKAHELLMDYTTSGFMMHKINVEFRSLSKGEGPYVQGGEPNTGMVSLDPNFPNVSDVDLGKLTSTDDGVTSGDTLRQDIGC